jgi:hypothetical protein
MTCFSDEARSSLEREGKRLVIHRISDLDQSFLLLEEQPTTMQL